MSADLEYFEFPRTGRVHSLHCTYPGCGREFRGLAPEACFDRHQSDHRYEQVQAVAAR